MTWHTLARIQTSPEVLAWCTCGAVFDAYGNKGALNKLNDHTLRTHTNCTCSDKDTSDYYSI